ncbi:hypothetical protein SERLA73DRAFT_166564 [Serpula lacrymans var. lacrymans S7.3]|uniref:RCC1-like domain-containing protein n=2 Tax=Serpula lacrymans var. lacrymans TaxID=341189 RepID=F8PPK5_SERL3|nr:uncharacterized protein SERLADRAFT_354897 [Serpula lacrymans var. lacrymans S7.9]EGO02063.1 hypothetical protein SERLA73DRAFT_166564 [Serpula lacrymans var. lacrymans S7.3]EGO27685.1 hypothetical protein SERLADRAFT_354897 [Serpula lacrymans var. lacrymans S7.9]
MSNPPLRRSTRAASVKPDQQAAAKAAKAPKPLARTASRTTKRPASPDPSPPPAKRSRARSEKPQTEHTKKVASKPASTKKVTQTLNLAKHSKVNGLATVREEAAPRKPYFNPLPTPPEKSHPGCQLFVWGAGNFGQFGMGADLLGEFAKPKKSAWIETKMQEGAFGGDGAGLEAVAAGGLHTLFIDENGTIWSCGVNDDAALGRVTKDVPDPNKPGSFLDIDELTAVPYPLQSLVDEKFRAVRIAAGDSISAAISSEGELRVWGSFRAVEGALGFSGEEKHQFLPKPILGYGQKPNDEKAVSVASGNNHLVVLTTHGNVYAWGAGEQGQLGRKILERRKIHGTVPEKIILGNRSNKAVLVGAGNYCSFAVDEEGAVWGWGLNTMGQTGTGVFDPPSASDEVRSPKKIPALSKEALEGDTVVEIAGGEHHTLFLTAAGKVYACGRCDGNQLGLNKDDNAEFRDRPHKDCIDEPMEIDFPDKSDPIIHISVGTHNNMVITRGGALYAWGEETQGELGVGEKEAETPIEVVRKEGGSWQAIAVACGGQHTLGMFRKKA